MRWRRQAFVLGTMSEAGAQLAGRPLPMGWGRIGFQRAGLTVGFRLRVGGSLPEDCVPWVPLAGRDACVGRVAGLNFSRLASFSDPTPVMVSCGRESCRDGTPSALRRGILSHMGGPHPITFARFATMRRCRTLARGARLWGEGRIKVRQLTSI